MGEAELHNASGQLIIHSHFVFYGSASNSSLANQISKDIQTHWNEPLSVVYINNRSYRVTFEITAIYDPLLKPETVWYNDDRRLNFFRIEEFAIGNISFVDGIGSNTGYFKLDNLLQTSTTAAHEYGHTIGLVHPKVLDIRGVSQPGIMYPRGTICDPRFQYWSHATPGEEGGFLDPKHRKVLDEDIRALKLHRLDYDKRGKAKVGEFTSLYHEKHQQ